MRGFSGGYELPIWIDFEDSLSRAYFYGYEDRPLAEFVAVFINHAHKLYPTTSNRMFNLGGKMYGDMFNRVDNYMTATDIVTLMTKFSHRGYDVITMQGDAYGQYVRSTETLSSFNFHRHISYVVDSVVNGSCSGGTGITDLYIVIHKQFLDYDNPTGVKQYIGTCSRWSEAPPARTFLRRTMRSANIPDEQHTEKALYPIVTTKDIIAFLKNVSE